MDELILSPAEAKARGYISIADALKKGLTAKHRTTLNREAKSGALPSCWVEKGSRPVLWVLKESLNAKLPPQTTSAYDALVNAWVISMRNGTFNRKPYSELTIAQRQQFLTRYWDMLGKSRSIQELNADNFNLVLGKFEHDEENQNDHYGLKMQVYSAVVGFMKHLVRQKLKSKQDRDDVVALRPSPRYTREKKTLEHDEILAIMKSNMEWRTGRTLRHVKVLNLILHLFTYVGIRRSEAITLKREHIYFDQRLIKVFGKGSKERIISPHPLIWEPLKAWVNEYCSDKPTGLLLTDAKGKKYKQRLINKMFEALSERCGRHLHPHQFRGAFALLMANAGMPLNQLQYSMGHDDINTTMGYFKTGYQHVRAWVQQNLEQPELSIVAPYDAKPSKGLSSEDELLERLLEA